ncbi:hypothetical protein H7K13_26625 [Priestia aryabhattai]|uniref:hypothetical protein n=1 Tax=Priestia aryabhattai TaxID=412384 RepID=UPI001C8D8789|nr:hypothetical protein [Priestia aryabhattai]MBY0078509.1 hypothetical protein [Priestia aryabhattai]
MAARDENYEYEKKIQQMKELKQRLEHENSLGSTSPEQIEANKWTIKRIDFALGRPRQVKEEPYVFVPPVLEKLKKPNAIFAPNLLLGE